jgi:photosystem II stability/assembly factor-like uncharacterized protein
VKATVANGVNVSEADILSIAINPNDANNIFFGTRNNGILKTTDGGETLTQTNFISEKVYGLAIDHVDGRIIYASGVWQKRGKIWKTLDGGETWSEIYTAASEGPIIISMTIDKKNRNVLYISTSDNQVLKSLDAGASWKNIFNASAPVLQIALDKANANLVYFDVMNLGIFSSHEGGAKAKNISEQLSKATKNGNDIKVIETDPSIANLVYAAGGLGLARSFSGGKKMGENVGIGRFAKFSGNYFGH